MYLFRYNTHTPTHPQRYIYIHIHIPVHRYLHRISIGLFIAGWAASMSAPKRFDRKVEWQDWSRPLVLQRLMHLMCRKSSKMWVWDVNRHCSRMLSRLVSRGKAGHWNTDKSGNALLVLFTFNAPCASFLQCPTWWKKLLDVFHLPRNGWALLDTRRKRIPALSRSLTIETEGKSEMSLKGIVQSEP